MAGSSMTFGELTPFEPARHLRRATITWVSDSATGAVSGTSTETYIGHFLGITTVPSGSAAPTTLYDITVKDQYGVDLLGGNAADRSATAGEWASASPYPHPVNGLITIAITNAGNSKEGTIYIDLETR